MSTPTLTFGIELEFICLRTDAVFKNLLLASAETGTVGPALYNCLLNHGIAATGWENIDEDILDDAPSHSRWRVETDELNLSTAEEALLPEGWVAESVELSSRKFHFFTDDWRRELATVLKTLRIIETQFGCRFITNKSAGFHVHVGNDTQRVPLRVAKNVFELVTAFERCFDELHTFPRIAIPDDLDPRHCYYPPSFFHAYGRYGTENVFDGSENLFDRLANIESARSYEQLGSFFEVYRPDFYPTSGHSSAYNFDNLYANLDNGRCEETLSGTIEFRQHTGTLDYMSIVAWVVLTCQLVQYAEHTVTSDFLDLCLRGSNMSFKLEDLLLALDCSEDVIDHYLHGAEVGIIAEQLGPACPTHPQIEALIEQNDSECEERSSRSAVEATIDMKYTSGMYGLDPGMARNEPPMSVAGPELKKALVTVHMSGIDERSEEGMVVARTQVFKHFSELYRSGIVKYDLALNSILEAAV